MSRRQGKGRGEEEVREGEKEKEKMMIEQNAPSSTPTCVTVCTITPSTITRHSHCLLNLVSTEKYQGLETQRGWRRP